MNKHLKWLLVLRGIFLILFGILAIGWPGLTVVTLTYIFALYLLVSGVLNIVYGIVSISSHKYWFLIILLGILEIGVGVYALGNPALTLALLIALIGIVFFVRGIVECISAFTLKLSGGSRVLHIIIGTLGILAGALILANPFPSALILTWVIGIYALVAGAFAFGLALTVKTKK